MKSIFLYLWKFVKSVFTKNSNDQSSSVTINNKVKAKNGNVSIDQSNFKVDNRNTKGMKK